MLQKLSSAAGIVRAVRNWKTALLDHAGVWKREYICEMRTGQRFKLRGGTDDRHVLFEIFVRNCYGEAKIRPGAVVVDIGANIGCFSLQAAQKASCVFAYEPFPANFDALRDNVLLNKAHNVKIFPTAVGGKAGKSMLFIPDNDSFVGRVSLHPGRGTRMTECTCITLDQVVGDNNLDTIDLLKIDCQGAEYEILYGASVKTLSRIQQIITECELYDDPPEWSIKALSNYLQNHGFKFHTQQNILHAWRSENGDEI
ncbi:MAG: FkbM family methyltransferase [Pyrinomonadaceae bacterium]